MIGTKMFSDLIANPVTLTTERYAAIVGTSPSQGARSPKLWNAAYVAAGIDGVMHPMDVTAAQLPALVAHLKMDARFVGGSVAVPHKQQMLGLLDRVEPETARIGAVNAWFREGNELVGSNTDGAAALQQLQQALPDLARRRALLIGLGGGGLAVAAYLADQVASLSLANRTAATAETFAAKLGGATHAVPLPIDPALLAEVDLLINASSVGFANGPQGTPLGADAGRLIAALPAGAFVYDIVYQPAETELLAMARKRGLGTLNGLGMNLEQAVIAFGRANPDVLPADAVRDAMRKAG